jgi:hypothetical protein
MGGAYNRVAGDATAFALRSERFLLEHIAEVADPCVDGSWATAHADGSGHVYPNFPDLALDDWAVAYPTRATTPGWPRSRTPTTRTDSSTSRKPSNQQRRRDMSNVLSAHAVSVDGYIGGRTPDGEEEFGRGLGDAPTLFERYNDGDTPSQVFDGFKLSKPSARVVR